MKRWLWILLAVLTVHLLGTQGTNLEDLEPVQLLQAEQREGKILLKTDTGSEGQGSTLDQALEDLKQSASGRIFLETAEQVLIVEGAESLLPGLSRVLRPGVRVIRGKKPMEPAQAAAYLRVHKTKTTLADVRAGAKNLPLLQEE